MGVAELQAAERSVGEGLGVVGEFDARADVLLVGGLKAAAETGAADDLRAAGTAGLGAEERR